jgi:transposase
MISVKNRKRRMDFVRCHEDHDASYWRRVLFSDESKFNRLGSDGRQYVRRRKDEEFHPRCTVSTLQGGGGSVMVWGVISAHGPGPLVRLDGRINSTKYIDMLDEHFVAYFDDNLEDNPIFMQDNAPIHTAANVKRFLQGHNISCLDWPAQSPDLNPIENVWHCIKQQLRDDNIRNLDELWTKIKEKWDALSPEYCRKLIEEMPKRLRAVKSQKGYATKY